jgi:transposase-like protein
MAVKTYLENQGCYPLTNLPITENLILELTHNELECPFCNVSGNQVCTWGSYKTESGEMRRYQCYNCKKTFNASKLPFIYERMSKVAFKLAKLVIKDGVSIKSVANDLNVPVSTLHRIIAEIEKQLAENFEFIKSLDSALKNKIRQEKEEFRVLYYDEGFHRILGGNYYLVFAVNKKEKVVQVDLTAKRDGETVQACLEQAITKMGGIDVIVSDGAPAILNGAKNIRSPVILVQQIHLKLGKRVRIYKLEPIAGRKALRMVTLEIHSDGLKPLVESVIRVQEKIVYPKKSQNLLYHQATQNIKKKIEEVTNRKKFNSYTSRDSNEKGIKKKDPFKDINWIWTPDTNF